MLPNWQQFCVSYSSGSVMQHQCMVANEFTVSAAASSRRSWWLKFGKGHSQVILLAQIIALYTGVHLGILKTFVQLLCLAVKLIFFLVVGPVTFL